MHVSVKKKQLTNLFCRRLHLRLIRIKTWKTYKFEQEGVFSQSTDTASKPQDEHHPSNNQKQPHRIKSTQIRDGGDIRQDSLRKTQSSN